MIMYYCKNSSKPKMDGGEHITRGVRAKRGCLKNIIFFYYKFNDVLLA